MLERYSSALNEIPAQIRVILYKAKTGL